MKIPPSQRIGVIDIGTNSVKLLVADAGGACPRVVRERVIVTRLGAGVDRRGRFEPGAVRRTVRAIRSLAREARGLGVARPVAVGTAALRRAADRAEFRRRLRDAAGLDLHVISGAREADLSFAGATCGRAPGRRAVVVDVGGGSTEVRWEGDGRGRRAGARPPRRVSLPLGAVALTERHLASDPVRPEEFRSLIGRIRRTLARALRAAPRPPRRLIAVGGTAATLAAMQLGLRRPDPARIDGARLTRAQVYAWLVVLSLLPVRRRLGLPGLERGRADIIVAGAAVLAGVLSALRAPSLTVSARGLRHGLALELSRGSKAKGSASQATPDSARFPPRRHGGGNRRFHR